MANELKRRRIADNNIDDLLIENNLLEQQIRELDIPTAAELLAAMKGKPEGSVAALIEKHKAENDSLSKEVVNLKSQVHGLRNEVFDREKSLASEQEKNKDLIAKIGANLNLIEEGMRDGDFNEEGEVILKAIIRLLRGLSGG